MNLPKISVIIPTRNRQEKLTQTVRCLQQQWFRCSEFEIIVVDDGSQPPVVLPEGPAEITCTLIRLEGVERSAARNAGAKAARGELLVFVDDDLSIQPDFLQAHLLAFHQWPGALQVGMFRLPSEFLATPFGRFRQRLEDTGLPGKAGPASAPNFCAAGNMAIPRSRFQELHGFNQDIVSSEDQDLALRHTSAGGTIAFVPEALVVHYDSAKDIRSYCRRAEWGSEKMIPFCRLYPNMPENIARERVNGPICWGREPLTVSIRKGFKSLLATPPVIGLLFWSASILERTAPWSKTLDRIYRLLLGAHIYRGFRKGFLGEQVRRAGQTRPQRTLPPSAEVGSKPVTTR